MKIPLEKRINAFAELGEVLRHPGQHPVLAKMIEELQFDNPWFTPDNVRHALMAAGQNLTKEKLQTWLQPYEKDLAGDSIPRTVAVIMAGNIPFVGFHDFLSVLISGNRFLGKLSSNDKKLPAAVGNILLEIEPAFESLITFTDAILKNFDAVIATGSNNTSRYFEYYFGKYPHIIRKNRNSIAVLTGEEKEEELQTLGKDIFQYFGLGCRNVSKIFVPENYDFDRFLKAMQPFSDIILHHKYKNNYDYYKAIYLVNGEAHHDNGFLLLKEEAGYGSPPSVLYYTVYKDKSRLDFQLLTERENIQTVVSGIPVPLPSVPSGKAQEPELWDYADGVDTLEFLTGL